MQERFDACWTQHGVGRRPRLTVRPFDKRWGSLSASGRSLLINRRLVEADVDSIDFVIMHELCHLTHYHHGPEFEALLGARMPDWRQRKTLLERWMV
jgi:predicted metal-dependent hydrolase